MTTLAMAMMWDDDVSRLCRVDVGEGCRWDAAGAI